MYACSGIAVLVNFNLKIPIAKGKETQQTFETTKGINIVKMI